MGRPLHVALAVLALLPTAAACDGEAPDEVEARMEPLAPCLLAQVHVHQHVGPVNATATPCAPAEDDGGDGGGGGYRIELW